MNDKEYIPIREASKLTGLKTHTLRAWANQGKVLTYRTPANQRMFDKQDMLKHIINVPIVKEGRKIIYCRVSSKKQLEDLERQTQYLRSKFPNHELFTDCCSGINFTKRKGLETILELAIQGSVKEVVVAHRDRLCRIGFDLIKLILSKCGANLIVLDEEKEHSEGQELTDDLLAIITVFACKQMGKRRYKDKQKDEETNNKIENKENKTNNDSDTEENI